MENKINLVNQENNKIIYKNIIVRYPWIITPKQKCILSPDSDGLLCGLLMSYTLNWEIVGFYDGKILLLKENENIKDCIFLDMDIFRNDIRSLGHHMVSYNKNIILNNWLNYDNCIQPNNIRNFDGKNNFKLKYPLGAIHLLLGIIGSHKEIIIKKDAICPLLYTDGTFKNLFNFPENCLNWLYFLSAEEEKSPLKKIFFDNHYTISSLMGDLEKFFLKLKKINNGKRGADKLIISNKNGNAINIEKNNSTYKINDSEKEKVIKFIKLLSELTGWEYLTENWNFERLILFKFKKETIVPSNKRYLELINKNPFSLAMTSTTTIEYTLDVDNLF